MSQTPSDPPVDDPFTTPRTDEPGYGEDSGYTEGTDYPAGTGYSGGTGSGTGYSSDTGMGSSSLGGYEPADTGTPSKADEAKEQGRAVAGSAKDEARNVAETAKSEASRVTGEAKAQTQNLLHEARGQFREQASGQTERAAGLARGLAGNLQALTEGRVDDAGQVGEYARQATDEVQRFAQRLDERGFDGLVQDLQSFARRRPGAFLLAAGLAGFATGRLLRGARDAASDDDDGQNRAGLYSGGGYDRVTTTDYTGSDYATDDYATTPRVTGPTSAGMANPSGVSTDPLGGGTTLGDSSIGGSRVRDEEGY